MIIANKNKSQLKLELRLGSNTLNTLTPKKRPKLLAILEIKVTEFIYGDSVDISYESDLTLKSHIDNLVLIQ